MSIIMDKNKVSAIGAWVLALFGGLMAGIGVGVIVISRLITDRIMSLQSNLNINAIAYGDIQIISAVLIILGVVFAIAGLFLGSRVQKVASVPPPPQ